MRSFYVVPVLDAGWRWPTTSDVLPVESDPVTLSPIWQVVWGWDSALPALIASWGEPEPMSLSSRRVVIVGAGPGGLAAALLLAKAGCQVKVLERLPQVGGRTSSLEAQGFRFDLGPTFFLYPRVLETIFQAVGRSLRDEVEMVRLDPQYHLVFGSGGELKATPDVARMKQELAKLSTHDAGNFERFLAENREKMARFQTGTRVALPEAGAICSRPT